MIKKKSDQQLIIQALNAAETNVRLAKTLLSGVGAVESKPSTKDLPGVTGIFDGENMVTEEGKKYVVNPNYASKSVLVYGDTLKRVEVDGKERFKQIERVKRQKVEGILAKKDGKFVAVTADGSYQVSQAAVNFYKSEDGDEVVVVLPLRDKTVPYAALESVKKDLSAGRQEDEKKAVVAPTAVGAERVKKPPTKKKVVTKRVRKERGSDEKEPRSGTVKEKPPAKKPPRPKDDRPLAGVEDDEELR